MKTGAVKQGGKKNRKYGRNKAKCLRYRNAQTREKNRCKRVLQSSGWPALAAYAQAHGLARYVEKRFVAWRRKSGYSAGTSHDTARHLSAVRYGYEQSEVKDRAG